MGSRARNDDLVERMNGKMKKTEDTVETVSSKMKLLEGEQEKITSTIGDEVGKIGVNVDVLLDKKNLLLFHGLDLAKTKPEKGEKSDKKKGENDLLLEKMSTLLRDKLEIKKELVMSGLERRGEGEREVLALSFLHREDKQEILSRRADLEAEGVRVTEDMADSQVEGWLKLGKLQEQVTEKYPNVQTLLSTDRLIVEDRVVTWDSKSKKLAASTLIFLPRKSKSRSKLRLEEFLEGC